MLRAQLACLTPNELLLGIATHTRALAPRVESKGWLQPLVEISIQRCCRIGIHVRDVDGLHYINMKLNLSASSYCRGFLLLLPKPCCLYTVNIPPGKSAWVGVGKEMLYRGKLEWCFFSIHLCLLALWLLGFCGYWVLETLGIFILFSSLPYRIKYYHHLPRTWVLCLMKGMAAAVFPA